MRRLACQSRASSESLLSSDSSNINNLIPFNPLNFIIKSSSFISFYLSSPVFWVPLLPPGSPLFLLFLLHLHSYFLCTRRLAGSRRLPGRRRTRSPFRVHARTRTLSLEFLRTGHHCTGPSRTSYCANWRLDPRFYHNAQGTSQPKAKLFPQSRKRGR